MENRQLAAETKDKLWNILSQLVDKSTEDLSVLQSLKSVALKQGLYSIGQDLLTFEREHFPEREDFIVQQEKANNLVVAFNMVGIQISPEIAWLSKELINLTDSIGGDFNLKHASELKTNVKQIFGNG